MHIRSIVNRRSLWFRCMCFIYVCVDLQQRRTSVLFSGDQPRYTISNRSVWLLSLFTVIKTHICIFVWQGFDVADKIPHTLTRVWKKKRIQQRKKMYFRSSDCPSVVFVSPSIILFFLFLYYLCIFFYYYYSDCSEDAIEYESHLNSNATIIYSIMMMVKVRERGRNEKWEIRSTYAPPRCSLFLCCSFTYARGTLHTRTKILKKKNKYE